MKPLKTTGKRSRNAAAIRKIHQEIASLYAQADRLEEIALSLSNENLSESESDPDTEDLQSIDSDNYDSDDLPASARVPREPPNPVLEAFQCKARNPSQTTYPTGEVDSLGKKIFIGDRVKFLTKEKNKSTCGLVREVSVNHRITCEDKHRCLVTRAPKNLTLW